jgi:hypothetical protein
MIKDKMDASYAKEFAIAFTIAVTETSDHPREWIAKNGMDSIFALLQELYPEASARNKPCCSNHYSPLSEQTLSERKQPKFS